MSSLSATPHLRNVYFVEMQDICIHNALEKIAVVLVILKNANGLAIGSNRTAAH